MDAFSLDYLFKEIKEENCYNIDNGYVQLTKAYPEVFTYKIGCLKGCKIHLQINKEIKPTIQSIVGKVNHLAEATEKAIDQLIQNDIIEPAPQPIRWLSQLAREGMKYEWTQKHEAVFEAIKSRLKTKVLRFFNTKWATQVICDASPEGLGAVLGQTNPQNIKKRVSLCT